MREEDVAVFLQEHPQFFEDHAEMLAGIVIPHPHGGRTISLVERQQLALRDKNKALEKKLQELLAFGKENDELQAKVHQFACELFAARDRAATQESILRQMRDRFAVPHAVMHVWEESPPSAEMLTFADEAPQPVCMHRAMYDTAAWFGESAAHLRSFAYVPLRSAENSIGLLILASEDQQRFYPEMGTLFLQRIGELSSAALLPWL
ncbi:MAG TPA: DUF484 family protein [Gallionellaceae bacterium]|nr:DUF484 family protein [Gallionellaceae bacterium]